MGAWGGFRPGAGRPPKQRNDDAPKTTARKKVSASARTTRKAAKPKAAPAQAKVPDLDVIAQIIEASKRQRQDSTPPHLRGVTSPFRLPEFPKIAIPKNKEHRIAFDEAIDWAAAQYAGGDFAGFAEEGLVFLGYNYLSELAQRPEYRVPVTTIADEMTRKWITFSSTGTTPDEKKDNEAAGAGASKDAPEIEATGEVQQETKKPPTDKEDNEKTAKIKELTDFLDSLKTRDRFYDLACQDGFFGRTHLYMDFGVSDAENVAPISDATGRIIQGKVKRNSLKRLQVIEPVWVYPTTYNAQNPLASDWYNPQVWYVLGKEIHKTRLPMFMSRPVPDILKPSYAFGGLSLSQMSKPYVDIWLTTRQSIADLIHAFSTMVLSTDLQTLLQPGGAGNLLARAALFNALRDNQGVMMINKQSEEFQNVSTPLGGLHELQAQSQEHMMAVNRIPAVKFTGMQPMGLNASSEGEMRAFNDTIKGSQIRLFKPHLDYLIDVAMITLWGKRDPDITYEFESLVELTEKERGEKRKHEAEAGKIFIEEGAISPEEERRRIISDDDSPYHGLDPDDVPEPPEDPEAEGGGDPFGGGGGDGPKKPPGGADEDPFGLDAWSEGDHPRGQPGNAGQFGSGGGGKSSGSKQVFKAPQFGMTPTPRESHQHEPDDGSGYFKKNWHKSGSVGGYNQPSPATVAKYTAAYENQGKPDNGSKGFAAQMAKPPLKTGDLKQVGKQLGSNPGGVFEDKAGKRYYIKDSPTPDHAKSELLAANMYALAGSPTLNYRGVEGGGKVATEWQTPTERNASKFTPAQKAEAQENFATHAWLANWDAAGLHYDNQNIIDGKATTVDVGGSLAYRAQGGPKGAAWGDKVGEWDTLRDAKINPQNADMFGDMTPAQMRASASKVVRIPDDAIERAVKANGMPPEMAARLIARKKDIAKRAGLLANDEAMMAAAIAEDETDAHGHEHAGPGPGGGQFVSQGGGGGSSEEDDKGKKKFDPDELAGFNIEEGGAPKFKSKKEHVGHLLKEGVTNAKILEVTGWKAVSIPPLAASLGMKIEKIKKDGQTLYKGVPMTDEEKAAAKEKYGGKKDKPIAAPTGSIGTPDEVAQVKKLSPKFATYVDSIDASYGPGEEAQSAHAKIVAAVNNDATAEALEVMMTPNEKAVTVKNFGSVKSAFDNTKAAQQSKSEPAKPAPSFPAPTDAEMKKASKGTTMPVLSSAPEAVDIVKAFNNKYAGKTLTDKAALIQKVNDYKTAVAAIAELDKKTKAQQAEQQKKADAELKAAAQKAEAEQKAKEKAEFDALPEDAKEAHVELDHVTHGQGFTDNFIKKATEAFQASSYNKVKMSGVEKAAIVGYTGSKYRALNSSLREGVMTKDQYAFTKAMNQGLSKLPPHKGTVYRKADLTAQQAALYKPGMIVEERGFTSTSKSENVWSGQYRYEIESLTGRDVAPLSSHKSEQEVLFRSGSRFEVTAVQGNKIHMKEVPIV